VSTISVEDYVKTARPYAPPGIESETFTPTLLSRAGKYIKANPWKSGLGAAGLLGAGALGAHLLGGDDKPAPAEMPEEPEAYEPAVGGLPDFVGGGLERGVGGAITEGAKALGHAAYLGGRRLMQGRRQRQVLEQVTATDPILSMADPEVVQQSFATMSRFAPTLASDPYAAQSFLREAVTSGGGINYNTIKLLAEAERAAQQV
jgi:hypothetical protein